MQRNIRIDSGCAEVRILHDLYNEFVSADKLPAFFGPKIADTGIISTLCKTFFGLTPGSASIGSLRFGEQVDVYAYTFWTEFNSSLYDKFCGFLGEKAALILDANPLDTYLGILYSLILHIVSSILGELGNPVSRLELITQFDEFLIELLQHERLWTSSLKCKIWIASVKDLWIENLTYIVDSKDEVEKCLESVKKVLKVFRVYVRPMFLRRFVLFAQDKRDEQPALLSRLRVNAEYEQKKVCERFEIGNIAEDSVRLSHAVRNFSGPSKKALVTFHAFLCVLDQECQVLEEICNLFFRLGEVGLLLHVIDFPQLCSHIETQFKVWKEKLATMDVHLHECCQAFLAGEEARFSIVKCSQIVRKNFEVLISRASFISANAEERLKHLGSLEKLSKLQSDLGCSFIDRNGERMVGDLAKFIRHQLFGEGESSPLNFEGRQRAPQSGPQLSPPLSPSLLQSQPQLRNQKYQVDLFHITLFEKDDEFVGINDDGWAIPATSDNAALFYWLSGNHIGYWNPGTNYHSQSLSWNIHKTLGVWRERGGYAWSVVYQKDHTFCVASKIWDENDHVMEIAQKKELLCVERSTNEKLCKAIQIDPALAKKFLTYLQRCKRGGDISDVTDFQNEKAKKKLQAFLYKTKDGTFY